MKTNSCILKKTLRCTGLFLLCFGFIGNAQNVTNYTFTATTGTYTAIQGTSGSVSPTLSGGNVDDGWFNSIPIGFPFTFEGVSYTTLSASTNGWFSFGNILSGSALTNNLNTGTPRPVVAPLWDDLAMNATGNFTYLLSGTAPNRILTLEWINMKWQYNAGSPGISFQANLYESNKSIEFIYRQEAGALNGSSASIGIAGVTSGIFLSLNGTGASPTASSIIETNTLNTKPATGQIYRFSPYLIQPTISSVTPLVGPLGTTITITGTNFDPLIAADVVYLGAVKGNIVTATSTQLTVTVPAGTTYQYITVTTCASFLTATSARQYDVSFSCGSTIDANSFNVRDNYSYTSGTTISTAAIGDIDGDGKPEIVTGNHYGMTPNYVSIYQNTATQGIIDANTFAARVDFNSQSVPFDIELGDIDGDGKLDVVTGDFGNNTISVFRNTSTTGVINSSSLAPYVSFSCGGWPRGVCIADIDMDGKNDILVACGTANYVSVFKNTSTPGTISLAACVNFMSNAGFNTPFDVAVGDLDGDGKPDMVLSDNTSNKVNVFRNTCTVGIINSSTFAAKVDFSTSSGPDGIKLADVDGDGKLDIATCNFSGNNISVLRNTATSGVINAASFAACVNFTTGSSPYNLVFGDVDGDGKPDVATNNNSSNTISVLKNTSTSGVINASSFAAKVDFSTAPAPYSLTMGDIDGDAKPEIVVANYSGNVMSVFQNMVSGYNAIAPATVTGSTSNCNNGTWKTYYDPANPTKILAAIKDNGNNLGTVTVNEYEDGAPGTYNGYRFLARHFKITPTTQPTTSVQVRLYFTAAEFTALQAVDPVTLSSVTNLAVTKYDGPTEDNIYSPGDATSLVFIPSSSITYNTAFNGYYAEFTISSFSEFWLHGGTSPLPIELLSFTATPENNHVNLNWSTATETNNDFFTIEKTKDGIHYEVVTMIDGAGNSNMQHNYSAIDDSPYEGDSYYRLKQTDFNGQFTYSDIVAVNFINEESLFSVFPNPAIGSVHILCPGDPTETITLQVFDHTGKLISNSISTIGELEEEQLNLDPGMYSLVVTRGETRFVKQVVIL